MFGGIPKLFDRTFVIGFFLPASLLFSGVMAILLTFQQIGTDTRQFFIDKSTFGATLSAVVVWLLSILLMAINRPFIRLLEGYGTTNPFRFFLREHKTRFRNKIEPLLNKMTAIIRARQTGDKEPEQEDDFRLRLWEAVTEYPENIENVLPTRLGNVMRAYERYSDVVYNMEAIVLWPRLSLIIPEDARNRIREGEALFYFQLNALLIGSLNLILYLCFLGMHLIYGENPRINDTFPAVEIPAISLLVAWFGWWLLPDAARQRGNQVKSVFDLYRRTLAEALGFELPTSERAERQMWALVSRKLTFRLEEDFRTLDEFRKKRTQDSNGQEVARNVKLPPGDGDSLEEKGQPTETSATNAAEEKAAGKQ